MRRTYKYRLYPSKEQIDKLSSTIETCRKLYNNILAYRKQQYQEQGISVSAYGMYSTAPELFSSEEIASVYMQVIQNVNSRVDKAYKNFFRRCKEKANGKNIKVGYPRFKSKDRYHSFTYPQLGFKILPTDTGKCKLKLSKIGHIKLKYHQTIPEEATIKTCTIKHEGKHWYVCLLLGRWYSTSTTSTYYQTDSSRYN